MNNCLVAVVTIQYYHKDKDVGEFKEISRLREINLVTIEKAPSLADNTVYYGRERQGSLLNSKSAINGNWLIAVVSWIAP